MLLHGGKTMSFKCVEEFKVCELAIEEIDTGSILVTQCLHVLVNYPSYGALEKDRKTRYTKP